jgi:DNA-binding XRE family transcriptional regulator
MSKMSVNANPVASERDVLGRAAVRAAERLGLSQADLAEVIGRDRTTISRRGIEPQSKPGELALMLIRCYRSLAVLVDDDPAQILHWMRTDNRHTGGIPTEQVRSVAGLVAVTEYLDAIRGRI